MNRRKTGENPRHGRVRFLECIGLVVAGLVSFKLAAHCGCRTTPWRHKDWGVWYNAQQLYRRDPEELTESELDDVKQWCRFLLLVDKHGKTGSQSLTDEECELIIETLERGGPKPPEHANLQPIYEGCRRRFLSGFDPAKRLGRPQGAHH